MIITVQYEGISWARTDFWAVELRQCYFSPRDSTLGRGNSDFRIVSLSHLLELS